MKTLIISGTVKQSDSTTNQLTYDLCLFGQSKENPLVQVIRYTKIECSGYDEMQSIARLYYAEYFKTDLFNIISIEYLQII